MSELPSQATREFHHAYGQSTPFSIGIEEEFQLVDQASWQLVPRVDEVLGHASDGERLNIKQELLQSVVEVATPPCVDMVEAEAQLRMLRGRVAELAIESDARIASAGTHPFARYELQQVTDAPRYHDLVERLQWIAQRELIFGLHVHVGMRSPDEAMFVFNHLRRYLPHLLALSSNSPFWQGRDTGLASSRSKVFDGFPRSGIPPRFAGWDEWRLLMQRAMDTGAIDDYTYVWWDVRPHPRFGTIEVRVCDAQTGIEETLALAALVQATAAWLADAFAEGRELAHHPDFLIAENKWSAARHGLAGEFIDLDANRRVPTLEALHRLVERVRPYAESLGATTAFGRLDAMLDGEPGAERQRAWHRHGGSLEFVTEQLSALTTRLDAGDPVSAGS